MNFAQAVTTAGFGFYSWRTDISPGPSFLAFEMSRMLFLKHAPGRSPSAPGGEPVVRQPQTGPLFDPDKEENKEIAKLLLKVLQRAGRAREKLTFGTVFEQLDLEDSAYRRTLRILIWLCDNGHAQKSGSNHATVYWAD